MWPMSGCPALVWCCNRRNPAKSNLDRRPPRGVVGGWSVLCLCCLCLCSPIFVYQCVLIAYVAVQEMGKNPDNIQSDDGSRLRCMVWLVVLGRWVSVFSFVFVFVFADVCVCNPRNVAKSNLDGGGGAWAEQIGQSAGEVNLSWRQGHGQSS